MTHMTMRTWTKILLVSSTILVSACSSQGSNRIASVGSITPGGGDSAGGSGSGTNSGGGSDGGSGAGGGATAGGGTGSNGTGGGLAGTGLGSGGTGGVPGGALLATAGNAVIGLAGVHAANADGVMAATPALHPVAGTVTQVLAGTGKTLVQLSTGDTVALDTAKGVVGEVVKLDLGSKTVVSAADGSSLVGVGVLSPTPATGQLASVNVGSGGAAVTIAPTIVPAVVSTVTGAVSNPGQAIGNVQTAVGGVVGLATGAVPVVAQAASQAVPVATGTVAQIVPAATGGGVLAPVSGVVAGVGGAVGLGASAGNGQASVGAGTAVGGVIGLIRKP